MIMHPLGRAAAVGLAALVALATAACGRSSYGSTTRTPAPVPLAGTVTVAAASSLSKVFPALATRFEALHPGTHIVFDFGSSGTLARQIVDGAPADVFASAAPGPMATLQSAHLLSGAPRTIARNQLEIVVKPGNPMGIRGLADLPRAGVVSLCAASAPCGSTADAVLARAHVTLMPGTVTLGQDVDATLAQVTTGDATAGLVYVTNAVAAGPAVTGVPIPASQNVTTSCPIAVLSSSSTDASLAKAWMAFVLGPVGSAALARAHFLAPG